MDYFRNSKPIYWRPIQATQTSRETVAYQDFHESIFPIERWFYWLPWLSSYSLATDQIFYMRFCLAILCFLFFNSLRLINFIHACVRTITPAIETRLCVFRCETFWPGDEAMFQYTESNKLYMYNNYYLCLVLAPPFHVCLFLYNTHNNNTIKCI